MKFVILLLIVCAVCSVSHSLNRASAVRICIIRNGNCRSTTPVCGRLGSSSICRRFTNNCARRIANCAASTKYNLVDLSNCRGIAVNRRGSCSGLSSSGSSNLVGNLNNLFGSNVHPIVIG